MATKLTTYPEVGQVMVTSLLEDRDGVVWFGGVTAAEGGALCEVRQGRANCHKDNRFGKQVWSLAEDPTGALWVGASASSGDGNPALPSDSPCPVKLGIWFRPGMNC
jgi:ligand-binding sensor domain-containing protein